MKRILCSILLAIIVISCIQTVSVAAPLEGEDVEIKSTEVELIDYRVDVYIYDDDIGRYIFNYRYYVNSSHSNINGYRFNYTYFEKTVIGNNMKKDYYRYDYTIW